MAKKQEDNHENLEKFVNRLYKKTINRYPRNEEEKLFIEYVDKNGIEAGVREFFLDKRFETFSDKEFVTVLFRGIMDTNPDEERFAFWCSKMKIRSRIGVINGFFLSDEWKVLCETYGVTV